MAEITAANVAKLREMTNAGMMDCKRALTDAQGDMDKAVEILRKKGAATAATKAAREAREGAIVQHVLPGARAGILVELNCETDFVARNDMFRAFAADVAAKLAADPQVDLEALRLDAVARIRENLKITRHVRMEVQGHGMIAAYIHTGSKIGVLVEIGAEQEATVATEDFKQLVRDITQQIAAASPMAVTRNEVPAAVMEKEDEINRQSDRLKGKPAQAIDKILAGMREKYYQTYCLVDQGFVKNPDQTVAQHVAELNQKLGDTITIRRFVRYQIGEAISA